MSPSFSLPPSNQSGPIAGRAEAITPKELAIAVSACLLTFALSYGIYSFRITPDDTSSTESRDWDAPESNQSRHQRVNVSSYRQRSGHSGKFQDPGTSSGSHAAAVDQAREQELASLRGFAAPPESDEIQNIFASSNVAFPTSPQPTSQEDLVAYLASLYDLDPDELPESLDDLEAFVIENFPDEASQLGLTINDLRRPPEQPPPQFR